MARSALGTVDKHGELVLTARKHQLPWLKAEQSQECVVEVKQRGLVYIWPVDQWAASEGISVEDAKQRLRGAETDPDDERDTHRFLVPANRKRQRGAPVHEIRLPDMALFVLFEHGQGPLTVRRGGGADSAKVLVITRSAYVELCAQSLF